MPIFLLTLVLFTHAFAHENIFRTRADKQALGLYEEKRTHPWPFPLLSIGHAMNSYQDYGGSPYWHDGLDIRSAIDQPIYAAAGGKVVNLENYVRGNSLYWEVAILDEDGFVWKYHHVDRQSIPAEIETAYKNRSAIKGGTLIGNVVRWPVSSFGEVYHHLHLLVVGADGKYINPFLLLDSLADTKAPLIEEIGIAQNHRPTKLSRVSGPHALYLKATDLILHDKFQLPPYKISYVLDGKEEKTVWEFIHLPGGASDTKYINDFHFTGTCGNYSCRNFYFNLNFTPEVPRSQMTLSPGKHSVEVSVEDIAGNTDSKSFSWEVF
jgi:hypothetical protein